MDPPTTTRRVYYSPKMLLKIIGFSALLLVTATLLSLLLPEMISKVDLESKSSHSITKTFSLELENQFLMLYARPSSKIETEYEARVGIKLYGSNDLILDTSRVKQCTSPQCDSFLIFFEPYLEYRNYELKLSVDPPLYVSDIELFYANKSFTIAQILIKYFFFVLSIHFLLKVVRTIRILKERDIEIYMNCALASSLVLFNDPLCVFSVYFPSIFTSFLSLLCISQFIFVLFLYWLLVFQGVQDLHKRKWIILVEMVMTLITYTLLLFALVHVHEDLKSQPERDWLESFDYTYKCIFLAVFIIFALLSLVMILSVLKACLEFKNMLAMEIIYNLLHVAVIMLAFVAVSLGLFLPVTRDGLLVVFLSVMFNLYVYMLVVFYRVEVLIHPDGHPETPIDLPATEPVRDRGIPKEYD